MIPDEAVEAAARAMAPAVWGPQVWTFAAHGETLTDARDRVRRQSLEDARRTLEAAAPFMLAEVWAEGAQAGFDSTTEGFNGECAFNHCAPDHYPPTNPYSGEPWEVSDWVEPA